MLNPIVIPIPVALIFFALLAAVLVAVDRYLRTDLPPVPAGQSWHPDTRETTHGRHRPENIAEPIDWATIAARRLWEQQRDRIAAASKPMTLLPDDTGVRLEIEAAPTPIHEEFARQELALRRPGTLELVVAEVPEIEAAGLPEREPIEPGPLHITAAIAVQSTHPEPCGFPEAVPCICKSIGEGDTRELISVA